MAESQWVGTIGTLAGTVLGWALNQITTQVGKHEERKKISNAFWSEMIEICKPITYDELALALERDFAYDQFGNMWVSNNTGFNASGTMPVANVYNGANRLNNTNYDAAGNQLNVNGSNMSYDAESKVAQVAEPTSMGGATMTYYYDGEGHRVEKLVNGAASTVYVYDAQGQLAAEYAANATAAALCQTCYLSTDHLGSTRMVTDGSGHVVARHDYLAFGEEIIGAAGRTSLWGTSDAINQKFTGKERDPESGLDYFGARYYGSALGRFTSPDWSDDPSPVPWADLENPQTLNLYSYVQNNPLSLTDSFGHADDPCKGIPNCVSVTAKPDDGPPLVLLGVAFGHHFVDQAITKSEGAWNSLAGQFFRRWRTGGPLKNPGVHTGYPRAARLNTQQIQKIVNDVKQATGRGMAQWTKADIERAVEEVRNAGGDTGKFLSDIAEENPTVRTVEADIRDVMAAAESAWQSAQQAASQVGPAVEEGAESVEEACGGGPACIP